MGFRGMKTLALLLLALVTWQARAEDLWVSVMTLSYHADREAHFNERNWGAGVEYEIVTHWRAVAGTYKNSVFNRSNYVGVHWAPWQFGNWHFGVIGGFISGYRRGCRPGIVPVVSWERDRVGANLIFVASESSNDRNSTRCAPTSGTIAGSPCVTENQESSKSNQSFAVALQVKVRF